MSALRVLLVDDEAHARKRLRRLIEKDATLEIVGECASGTEAVAAVAKLKPELMLLDVQMPELDGFGVMQAIPAERLPLVVFVTAHVEHAVHAFDVHAVDYVLKPVEGPRLFAAIARARQRAVAATVSAPSTEEEREASAPLGDDAPAPSDRMLVRHEGQLYPIRARDVLYVEADGNYARIHLLNRRFLVRETMARLERRFDPKQFTRIHRSTIVNLDVVTEVQPYFGGDFVAILKTGTRLKVSRHYKHRLDRWVLG